MNRSFSISDELLSAYIDGQLDEAEMLRVEKALAQEPEAYQRLQGLQAIVDLLHDTPEVVVPRAFVLSEEQVLAAGGRVKGMEKPSLWQRWLPRMMPAFTAIIALLFFFSLKLTPPTASHLPPMEYAAPQAAMVEEARDVNETAVEAGNEGVLEEAPAAAPKPIESEVTAPVSAETTAKTTAPQAKAIRPAAPAREKESAEEAEKTAAKEMPDAVTLEAAPAAAVPEEPVIQAQPLAVPAEENSAASAEETIQPQPSPQSQPTASTSWISWLLGALLILSLFFTWRFTFRGQRDR